jgi:hypothetical protein
VTLSVAVNVLQMVDEQCPSHASKRRKLDMDFSSLANTVTQRVTSALLTHPKNLKPSDPSVVPSNPHSSNAQWQFAGASAPVREVAMPRKRASNSNLSLLTCWDCGGKGHKRGDSACGRTNSKK